MKHIIYFAWRQWKSELRKADFWVTMLCLFVFFSLFFAKAGSILRSEGGEIGIFSVYPISMADSDFVLILLAGFLMVISDIPVMVPDVGFQVIRSDRSAWYLGQAFYGVLMSVTYFLAAFLLELFFYLPAVSIESRWGSSVLEGRAFLGEYQLDIPPELLKMSALHAVGNALMLSLLLGCFFAMLCCVVNMAGGNGAGLTLCALFVVLDRINHANSLDMGLLSPVGILRSYYDGTWVDVGVGLGYLFFWVCVLLAVGFFRSRKIDLNTKYL